MNLLDPIAEAMFRGRAFADSANEMHRQAFSDLPATPMTRAHAMRSGVQAQLILGKVGGFSLIDAHLWAGKVEVVHDDTLQHYLLKSRNALPFETTVQGSLLEGLDEIPAGSGPLLLLLYEFVTANLALATAPVERGKGRDGRVRYLLLDRPKDVGVWRLDEIADIEPFDQGATDDFGDLSEDVHLLGQDEEDEG